MYIFFFITIYLVKIYWETRSLSFYGHRKEYIIVNIMKNEIKQLMFLTFKEKYL